MIQSEVKLIESDMCSNSLLPLVANKVFSVIMYAYIEGLQATAEASKKKSDAGDMCGFLAPLAETDCSFTPSAECCWLCVGAPTIAETLHYPIRCMLLSIALTCFHFMTFFWI